MEVATFGGSTSRDSVDVRGLPEAMAPTEGSGISAVTGATGVRGSGLTMVLNEEAPPLPLSSSVSFSMASELRITRKCVLSDGVMVTVFRSSGLSFLVIWILDNK